MKDRPLFDDHEDAVLNGAIAGLVEVETAIAALEAERARHLATAMRVALNRTRHRPRSVQEREMALRSIAAEIAVALRGNDRTMQRRLHGALSLVDDFPRTFTALNDGVISAAHAEAIREVGVVLTDPEVRAAYESRVGERAAIDTAARTRAYARALVEELRPETIDERFAAAEQHRRVWIDDDVDGMARLGVIDGAAKIRAMYDRLTRQARAVREVARDAASSGAVAGAGTGTGTGTAVRDVRTLDQTRADLLCDLVLAGQLAVDDTGEALPGGLGAIRAHVAVTVPVATAAGRDDRGAIVDGQSPIDADTARQLMAGAGDWDRVLTHPVTATVLEVDRYRPTPTMRRRLAARDVHCRFPGCRQPARRCQVDHTHDHAKGGRTALSNLAHLCTRHHTLKTETTWTAEQRPDGSLVWTSPLRRRTVDRPETTVAFTPGPELTPRPEPPPF